MEPKLTRFRQLWKGLPLAIGKTFVRLMALLFLIQLALAVLGIPGAITCWIEAVDVQMSGMPRYIVVLGGGGIPSASGLMRTFYAAKAGLQFPEALIIVALPTHSDPASSHIGRMRDELVLRGISADRIRMEYRGVNTYQQVANICSMLGQQASREPILVVTSPYHLRRALLCFHRQGFTNAAGAAVVEMEVDPETGRRETVTVSYSLAETGADSDADMGEALMVRYSFWLTLQDEVDIAREFVALGYYKLRGWI